MTSTVVNPRFSAEELREIDRMVTKGVGKSRSDFVRMATVYQMKRWNNEPSKE